MSTFFAEVSDMLSDLENHARNKLYQGFPFVDIKFDGSVTTIDLAVAGYAKKDLEVAVVKNMLTVTGKKNQDDVSLYRVKQIKSCDFTRKFTLRDGAYIDRVTLENGILSIELRYETPEEDKPKVYVISEE